VKKKVIGGIGGL